MRRSPLMGTIRIGYVPLVDAAPLLVAEALDLYAKRGLAVSLSTELGWGSVREKVVYGEIGGCACARAVAFFDPSRDSLAGVRGGDGSRA